MREPQDHDSRYHPERRRAVAGHRPAPHEKVGDRHALDALGVDVIEAGFAVSSPGRLRGRERRRSRGEPTHGRISRPHPQRRHRRRRRGARRRAAPPHPHLLATSPIHMEKKLRLEPDEVVEQARWVGRLRPRQRRRGRVLLRGRDPLRPALRRQGVPRGDRSRRDDDQPPRHRRLLPAGGVRELPARSPAPLPRARGGLPLRPLPQRPRARGRQLARRSASGRDPDRGDHQRARRASRERGPRGDRHGAPRSPRLLRDSRPASSSARSARPRISSRS